MSLPFSTTRVAPKLTRPDYDLQVPSPTSSNDEIVAVDRENNPWVYIDFRVDEEPVGRLVIELFANVVPITAENFRAMCVGSHDTQNLTHSTINGNNNKEEDDYSNDRTKNRPLLIGTTIFRIINRFMLQGGNVEEREAKTFRDENFKLHHDRPYLLSMANNGPDTNGSQFIITTVPCPHLDNKHVVFGHVVHGQGIVSDLEALPTDKDDAPLQKVVITHCGQLTLKEPIQALGLGDNEDEGSTQDVFPYHPEDLWLDWYCRDNFQPILEIIGEIRLAGNHYFNATKDLKKARRKYSKALKYVELLRQSTGGAHSEEEETRIRNVQIPAMLNLAAVQLKLGCHEEALKLASDVLTVQPCNVKALFRRSRAYGLRGDFELALNDLNRLEQLMQSDEEGRAVALEKVRIKAKQDVRVAEERKLYAKMLA